MMSINEIRSIFCSNFIAKKKIIPNFIAYDIWKWISDGECILLYFIFQQCCQKHHNINIIIYMYLDKKVYNCKTCVIFFFLSFVSRLVQQFRSW